jgi:hypothetical protein
MTIKKFLAVLLLPALLVVRSPIAFAEEDGEGDYTFVSEHEKAPFSGYLFTPESVATMIATCDKRIKLELLEKETELIAKIINLETEIDKKNVEININKKMNEDLLSIKQQRIDSLTNELFWNKLFVAGGFVGGVAITIGVVYLTSQALR